MKITMKSLVVAAIVSICGTSFAARTDYGRQQSEAYQKAQSEKKLIQFKNATNQTLISSNNTDITPGSFFQASVGHSDSVIAKTKTAPIITFEALIMNNKLHITAAEPEETYPNVHTVNIPKTNEHVNLGIERITIQAN